MNLETIDDIYETIYDCRNDYTESNKKIAFKCVERAKILNDLDLEFEARFAYLEQLVFLKYYEEAIPLYPWLLSQCDEYPDRFNYFEVLWAYKWIVAALGFYASIPKTKIHSVLADFERRFRDYGTGEKLIFLYRMRIAVIFGEFKEAFALFKQHESLSEKSVLDDCEACVPNYIIGMLVGYGNYEEALKVAKPILEGRVSCTVVPSHTYPQLVEAALMLDKWELAEKYHQLGQRALKKKVPGFEEFSKLLWMLAIQQKFIKGKNIIQAQLNLINRNTGNLYKMNFYHACYLFFYAMFHSGKKFVTLQLNSFPDVVNEFVKPVEENRYIIEELVNWFGLHYKNQQQLLDARNQNQYYEEYLQNRTETIKTLINAKKAQLG